MQEIFHRRSLPQKLGVGRNIVIQSVRPVNRKILPQLRARLYGHGALFYHQSITACLLRNGACYSLNGGQVGVTVGQGRSSDTDKDGATVVDGCGRRSEG